MPSHASPRLPARRRRSRAALSLLATLATTACATRSGPSPEAIGGRTWQLVELGGAAVPAAGGERPSLRFEQDGRLTGQGGCNGFGGRWTMDGDRLVASEVVATMRACLNPARTAQEGRFIALVDSRPRVALRGDTLVLEGGAEGGGGGAASARLVAAGP